MTTCLLFAEEVIPKNEQNVYTSVEGKVKYFVKEGQIVNEGKPLFFITRNDICEDNVTELKHEMDYNADLYNRDAKLIKTNSISEQEYENAKIAYAKSIDDYKIDKDAVDFGLYKAPYNCKIIKLLYPQGSGIGDGNPVITIEKIITNTDLQKK